MAAKEEIVVVSLGGSLIVPDEINVAWLSDFKALIESYVKKGMRFIIICGGGRTARNYQNAAKQIVSLTGDDLDWIGIHCTRLNAHLLRTIFSEEAYPRVIKNPTEELSSRKKILIAAGWKPGCSTDYDAVLLAKSFGIKKLANLTNIDYVYDKDPKFPDAKPIREISWKEMRKLLPEKWDPGLNCPFDPVAAKEAEKLKLEVAIMNGSNLENFRHYLDRQEFIGTMIR
jgi:uridylate kinase